MKTARERAEEWLTEHGITTSAGRLTSLERMFKEAMRDQRAVCAAAVDGVEAEGRTLDPSRLTVDALSRAHQAVSLSPFPGEER